ncbi:NUDIX domain-containing protein [Candidatus Woesebacteria bacterium]|nr:NUDIX domain-containing protein [Candidatus Woesebacteria bacterium]
MIPKICFTAGGVLIHENKVLLVKHKKLGMWLNPGGHIETNELPHHAAEREYFEETGIKVEAWNPQCLVSKNIFDQGYFIPNPIATNVHWVCKENFVQRQHQGDEYMPQKTWSRGCEKHCNFLYLVRPLATVDFTQNIEETEGIQWFSEHELQSLVTDEDIKVETLHAFSLVRE